jgi:hypothetical protein
MGHTIRACRPSFETRAGSLLRMRKWLEGSDLGTNGSKKIRERIFS